MGRGLRAVVGTTALPVLTIWGRLEWVAIVSRTWKDRSPLVTSMGSTGITDGVVLIGAARLDEVVWALHISEAGRDLPILPVVIYKFFVHEFGASRNTTVRRAHVGGHGKAASYHLIAWSRVGRSGKSRSSNVTLVAL